jgi:uncharacterized protein
MAQGADSRAAAQLARAAESAEKLSIIFGRTRSRKRDAHRPAMASLPDAVLDTQVVLDWLVFRDLSAAALGAAITDGRLSWIASAAMRAELEQVLDRGVASAWRPDRAAVADAFDRLSRRVESAPLPMPGLRCSDPDDQMFIDLALSAPAAWLFTRDRALLRLARRARERGVVVLRPADWRPHTIAVP